MQATVVSVSSRFTLTVAVLALISAGALRGQTAPIGIPDDWSFHHLIFSNPGTAEDAYRAGRYDEWLRITTDPRYQIQQMKRGQLAAPTTDYAARAAAFFQERTGARRRPSPGPISSIKNDWSMNMGGAAASLIGTVGTVSSSTVSGISNVVINGTTIYATPSDAFASASFTNNPTYGQTLKITNGGNSETLTATGDIFASGQGTFSGSSGTGMVMVDSVNLTASPGGSATGSITIGTTYCFPTGTGIDVAGTTLLTAGSAGTGTYSVTTSSTTGGPSAGDTVVIGGATYTFETTLSGTTPANQILVPPTGGGWGTTQGDELAENISVAVNNTGTCGYTSGGVCTKNVTGSNSELKATWSSGASGTLTAICTGNASISGTSDGSHVTIGTVAAGGGGTTSASGLVFAIGSSNTATATQIYDVIHGNTTYTNVMTATNPSGAVDLTWTVTGLAGNSSVTAANTVTVSGSGVSGVTVTGFSGGTAGSTSGSTFSTSTDSDTASTNLDNEATALASAINTNVSTAVHASASGDVVTITDKTFGTGGNNIGTSGTLGLTLGWSGADLTGGENIQTGSTYFAFTDTSGNALTTTQTATNLAAVITNSTVGVTGSSSGAQVTITANTTGTGGNSIDLTDGLSNITWPASLSGGVAATQDGTDFEYLSGVTYLSSTQLATNIASTINANSTLSPNFTATVSGSNVIVAALAGGTGANSDTASVNSFSAFTWGNSGNFSGGITAVDASMGAGVYPAKYNFSPTATPSCTDFVAYNTGLAGSSSTPSIVAYNNIYDTTCTGQVPSYYFQFNTDGGQIVTSPVLSLDGAQMAFVQTEGSNAYLVVLKLASSSGLQTLSPVATTSYRSGCSAPCMTQIEFNGPANDTISSPYYVYGADVLYVGDAAGNLHEFTGVFNSTPAENTTSPWPVTVDSDEPLTSPIYDPVSNLIFVNNSGADAAGYLYSVTTSGSTKVHSYELAAPYSGYTGIYDGPIVDSTSKMVYTFAAVDTNTSNSIGCDNTTGCNGVYQLPTTFTSATSWNESVMGVATTIRLYVGAFDNQYFTSENSAPTTPTGNLYVCGTYGGSVNEPKLMDAIISGGAFVTESGESVKTSSDTHGTVYFATNIAKPMTSALATCSPVTEIYNTSTSTDYIYMSVTNDGSLTPTGSSDCSTGDCVYSWNTTSTLAFEGSGATITQPLNSLNAAGGTGGLIIDNVSILTGASQVYFGTLGSGSCSGNGQGPGTGTGGCAVQASQSGLH